MTNEERRQALNKARRLALEYAENAIMANFDGSLSDERRGQFRETSLMWAAVGEVMKDGDPVHDGPDGYPEDDAQRLINHGVITR